MPSSGPLEGQTYFVYIDDSGSENHDVLSALCIPAPMWADYLEQWRDFRRWMERSHGIPLAEEFHSIDVGAVSKNRLVGGVKLNYEGRSKIASAALKSLASMSSVRILTTYRDAQRGPDLYEDLLDLLTTFCLHHKSWAVIWFDGTDESLLKTRRAVHRKLGYDRRVIEDPHALDSRHSSLIQMADIAAYVSYQRILQIDTESRGKSVLRNGYAELERLTWKGFDSAGQAVIGLHEVS